MQDVPQTGHSDVAEKNVVDEVARQIDSSRLGILLRHWAQVRGRRLMPGWPDLDPAEMAPVLSQIWAWDYHRDAGRFTGHLAGEKVRNFIGRPIVHMPMEVYFEHWNHAEIIACRRRVTDLPAIGLQRGQIFRCDGQVAIGERLMLPLARDGLHADMIIGASIYELRPDVLGGDALPALNREATPCHVGGTTTQFFSLSMSDHPGPSC